MIKRTTRFILFTLAFYACTNQTGSDQQDSYGERLAAWFDYYGIQAEDMIQTGTHQQYVLSATAVIPSELDLYRELLVFTPDSILALDLDSYHLVIRKEAEDSKVALGREADMEIALINFNDLTRQRVLFCGTPCLFEEGDIMDDGRVVVAGFTEDNGLYKPSLWTISSDLAMVSISQADKAFKADEIQYIKEVRLKHIRFDFHPGPPGIYLSMQP